VQEPVDILILSNGPGEVTTWVRPVVGALRHELGNREQVRISVILSPCANASGQEAAIAHSFPEVDRVQAAEHFFSFLLWGKTAAGWQWHKRGVVLFLGGDQFFSLAIAKRLGYRTVVYAEREARWWRWIDQFGITQPCQQPIPAKYTHKLQVIGDLMVEAGATPADASAEIVQVLNLQPHIELIGLLPGSKPAKLAQGVPLWLAIAEHIHVARPDTQFVIPVAPTLDVAVLGQFADPTSNPVVRQVGGVTAQLITSEEQAYLQTENGLRVDLWTGFPAHSLLSACTLCLTTVGANTAELGALAVPMLVLLPTQQLDAMRAWDGLPGLLANLPLVGTGIAKGINRFMLERLGLLAWPNIWAGREIVPELVGHLQPQAVAAMVIDLLDHPAKLNQIRDNLRSVRGETGAAQKLAHLVKTQLNTYSSNQPLREASPSRRPSS